MLYVVRVLLACGAGSRPGALRTLFVVVPRAIFYGVRSSLCSDVLDGRTLVPKEGPCEQDALGRHRRAAGVGGAYSAAVINALRTMVL